MKLTDRERRILFEAITIYRRVNSLERTYTAEQRAEAEAVSSLRTKLKKELNEVTP